MKKRVEHILLITLFFLCSASLAQNEKTITDTIIFSPSDAVNNFSTSVNESIQRAKYPLVIFFKKGTYHFSQTLKMKSNVSLVGENKDSVIFNFHLKGTGNLINIQGSSAKAVPLDNVIYEKYASFFSSKISDEIKNNDVIKIFKRNPDIELSEWAKESVGQIIQIKNAGGSRLDLFQQINLNYGINDSAAYRKIKPIENVRLEGFTMIRKDESKFQTSNINLEWSLNCSVKNIISSFTNFTHIEINNSLNTLIEDSDFYNSFSHGNGGKGYGVCVQNSSSNSIIKGCIFRKLRHGVLLQSGANGNLVLGNYFLEGYWEDVKLPKFSAGDIVLHGNYPYRNRIEGNVCNQIVIDKSHGLNGPDNVVVRNRTLGYGIFVASKSIQSLEIVNNDIVKKGFLIGKIRGKKQKMILQNNRRNNKNYKSRIIDAIEKDDLNDSSSIYRIGYPFDFFDFNNKAMFRYEKSTISRFN